MSKFTGKDEITASEIIFAVLAIVVWLCGVYVIIHFVTKFW